MCVYYAGMVGFPGIVSVLHSTGSAFGCVQGVKVSAGQRPL